MMNIAQIADIQIDQTQTLLVIDCTNHIQVQQAE
jgi:hypothetical protein